MGITPRFTPQDIARQSQQQLQAIENGMIRILFQVGLQFMTEAKDDLNIDTAAFPTIRKGKEGDPARGPGEYLDQTSALRSSIGFFVLKNGHVIYEKVDGVSEGVSAAQSLVGQVPKVTIGYQLIGVAGMDYASYLEAKGFNVITSQSVVALVNLDTKLKNYATYKGIPGFDIDAQGVSMEFNIKA